MNKENDRAHTADPIGDVVTVDLDVPKFDLGGHVGIVGRAGGGRPPSRPPPDPRACDGGFRGGKAAPDAARRWRDEQTRVIETRGLMHARPPSILYERAGWRRLGKVSFTLPDGSQLEEYVYCEP
jgi:hypothetical protein